MAFQFRCRNCGKPFVKKVRINHGKPYQFCSVACGVRFRFRGTESLRRTGVPNCRHPNARHCRTRSAAYGAWRAMIQRCLNPNCRAYRHYGGRGITVCDEWRTFAGFYRDMGDPPKGYLLERTNNDDGYHPENCRWATRKEQARNTRRTPRLTANGETLPLSEWAERIGCDHRVLHARIKRGWSEERVALTPCRKRTRDA